MYAKQREVEGIKKLIVQERQENEVHTASLARAEADLTQGLFVVQYFMRCGHLHLSYTPPPTFLYSPQAAGGDIRQD